MGLHWHRGRHQRVGTDWDRTSGERHDFRTEAALAWERRLRGYGLFAEQVELEPAYSPYAPNIPLEEAGWDRIPQPKDSGQFETVTLAVLTVAGEKLTMAQADGFLAACRGLGCRVSLEVVATSSNVTFTATVHHRFAEPLAAAFGSLFPQARLELTADPLLHALGSVLEPPCGFRVVDWGLYHPAYRSLRVPDNLLATPQAALVARLGSLREGEVAGLQLLLEPVKSPWAASMSELLEQFEDGTVASRSAKSKLASPLWACAFRVFGAVAGGTDVDALDLCRRVGDTFATLGEGGPQGTSANELMPLDDAGYPIEAQLDDLIARRSRRTGMLLSQGELPGLWHPPAPHVTHPKLRRFDPSFRELPDHLASARGPYLGVLDIGGAMAEERTEPTLIPWPDDFRNRHAYFLGATRMGKSTLMLNLITQDLLAGRGLCLIDPHGDLAHDVLDRIPPDREADVLFVDLSDGSFPPAVGLLEAGDEWEERLLVSDLLAILHRLFRASWGDRLEHILRHALLTLLADPQPHSLRDVRPLLANKPYRDLILGRLKDPSLRGFWHGEYPSYSATAFAPVYNKLGLLMTSPTVRNVISGTQSRLRPGDLIRDRRVLIVNLAQSLIGEDNAHFLGALLVSKVQLAAMHNLRRGRAGRTEFTLYVDEFQNFVVSSFEKILSEAGKAGLSLVMANQFLEQLNDGLQTAILSNAGTMVSFRVSAESGRRLEGEFGGLFGAKALTDLDRGRAAIRLGRAGDSFAMRTFPPVGPEVVGARPAARDEIIARTRAEVCRPRREVEAEFRASEEALEELIRQAEEQQNSEPAATKTTKANRVKPAKSAGGNRKADPPSERQRKSDDDREKHSGSEAVEGSEQAADHPSNAVFFGIPDDGEDGEDREEAE